MERCQEDIRSSTVVQWVPVEDYRGKEVSTVHKRDWNSTVSSLNTGDWQRNTGQMQLQGERRLVRNTPQAVHTSLIWSRKWRKDEQRRMSEAVGSRVGRVGRRTRVQKGSNKQRILQHSRHAVSSVKGNTYDQAVRTTNNFQNFDGPHIGRDLFGKIPFFNPVV